MAIARPVRALALAAIFVLVFCFYNIFQPGSDGVHDLGSLKTKADFHGSIERDPNLDLTGEPPGNLVRTSDAYAPGKAGTARIPATLLALVRNEELEGMLQSMEDLERTWNHKFNYPWTFFNDVPFTAEFKRKTSAATKAECRYEVIPKEHWEKPSWINDDLFAESVKILEENDIQYASMLSYHQMCRWNSGLFYKHPALADIQYYWRVEPKVHFFCDVDYDVFRYMQDSNKTYGFTITLYDAPKSIPSLWPETTKFIEEHPEYLHENRAEGWLTDNIRRPIHNEMANGYSTCHFWTNFEIADMNFWRSQAYEDYFNHLDRAGGFFYERWGDAPVHSIALGLFEDKNKIHWFRDIGYQHIPFFNCPNSPKCRGCETGRLTDGEKWLNKEDCRPNWFKYAHMN
ncbi:putative glycosyltransferase family 15 protein [Rosellinia necatrix]|uniref:Putative glycosyltransferase family 15 protein n=1 Tax=Rosellinia necatrix TaxID=77044 RepID=A0A1S7UM56_ROSNE|nr:putative glycosyltransferase family 15 protein [Rosellinia necatrix]